jgi:hypothetical protein
MVDALNTTMAVGSIAYNMNGGEGFGSWLGLMVIVFFAAVILVLFTSMLSSFQNYRKIRGVLGWLINTVRYFFFGVATLFCLAVPVLIFYYFISQARRGNVAPTKITFYIISGYVVICLIGYVGKKIYERIKKFEKKVKVNKNAV